MYSFQQEKIQLTTLSTVKLNYELTITPSIQWKRSFNGSYLSFF